MKHSIKDITMKPDTGIDPYKGDISREGHRDGNPGFIEKDFGYAPAYTPWGIEKDYGI